MNFFPPRLLARCALLSVLPFANVHADESALDASFGTAGRRVYDLSPAGDRYDRLHALGSLPEGGYVAVASRRVDALDAYVFLVRLADDGAVVAEFDTGIADVYLDGATVDPQGRVVLARVFFPAEGRGVQVERRWPGGPLDTAFGGGDGITVLQDANSNLYANAISLDAAGFVAIGGNFLPNGSAPGADYESFAAVLEPDGDPLAQFGGDGIARVDSVPLASESVRAVLRDAAGRVLLCGHDSTDAIVTRLLADGMVDIGFGGGGSTLYDASSAMENWFDSCTAMATSPSSGLLHIAMEHRLGAPVSGEVRVLEISEYGQHAASVPAIMSGESYPGPVRLTFDAQGRALVAAVLRNAASETDLHVARLTPALGLDPSFAGAGFRVYPLLLPESGARRDADLVAAPFIDRGMIVVGTTHGATGTDALWAIHRLQGPFVFADGFE